MPTLTPEELQALQGGFGGSFRAGYSAAELQYQAITTSVPVGAKVTTWSFMERMLKMRKWVGPRVIQNLESKPYQVTVEKYEGTVGVDEDDWADDNLGIYAPTFEDLGRAAALLPEQLVIAKLIAGETDLGYDDKAMFATDHPLGAGQSNLKTSQALTADNAAESINDFVKLKDADGDLIGVRPDTIVVPQGLSVTASTIFESDILASGASNPMKGKLKVIVMPRLSADSDTSWYLMDTSHSLKSLLFLQREAVSLTRKDAADDDGRFYDGKLVYGLKGRCAAGYGPWFLAQKNKA